ncbi:hypothetical protein [Halocynthiibacter styelae]|uniref:Cytochrome C oxidase assembly protein n=1 Tax=Halocynthiibacter styelae TaxID=2761955 RepID=A0A8J7J516_9RHOB|nr:hypothetical protein [Paenihalocynthiibacter styelae]MBI1493485.1 hypothetical protein [Paenihalocynthiibacter styelae]
MDLKVEHEMHKRRFSRNAGLGFVLVGLVVLVFGITIVKVRMIGNVPEAYNAAAGLPTAEAGE